MTENMAGSLSVQAGVQQQGERSSECGLSVVVIAESVAQHWLVHRCFPPIEALPIITPDAAKEARLIALDLANRAFTACRGCCNCCAERFMVPDSVTKST